MDKVLVLLAGYPGTGKSYLANLIMGKFTDFQLLSPDDIKEKNWDLYGFKTIEEKESLIQKSWHEYYEEMEKLFQSDKNVISEYPFSDKQKNTLENLSKRYQYKVVTIRLVADLDILFERQKKRDMDINRHLGHILKEYHQGITITHNEADNLVDYDEFIRRCTTRGYDTFSLGTLFEIDVTDFSKVNYKQLIENIIKTVN